MGPPIRAHLPVTAACTSRVAEDAHAKTRLHTWRGPGLPRAPLILCGGAKWRSCPRKSAQKRTGVGPATSSPLSALARSLALALRYYHQPLPAFLFLPLCSQLSALCISLFLRPLPLSLSKERLFLTRVLAPFQKLLGFCCGPEPPRSARGAPADLS